MFCFSRCINLKLKQIGFFSPPLSVSAGTYVGFKGPHHRVMRSLSENGVRKHRLTSMIPILHELEKPRPSFVRFRPGESMFSLLGQKVEMSHEIRASHRIKLTWMFNSPLGLRDDGKVSVGTARGRLRRKSTPWNRDSRWRFGRQEHSNWTARFAVRNRSCCVTNESWRCSDAEWRCSHHSS